MGGASVANLAISVLRMKALAVLLGPAGLGLLAIYNSVMSTANALFGAGLGFSGVKHVAQTQRDSVAFHRARLVLWYGSLGLGILAVTLLWFFRALIAEWVMGDRSHGAAIAAIGIGVAFSLLASSQTAVLQGQRRIADLAKVQVLSSALAALGAVAIVAWLGEDGIVAAVLVGPIIGFLVGYAYLGGLRSGVAPGPMRERFREFRIVVALGTLFMVNSVIAQLSEAWVRVWIGRELGIEVVGQFQAAWVISQSYLGVLLAASTAEYFPRLSDAVQKRDDVTQLVDGQVMATLLLLAPFVLLAIAYAPVIVKLLFDEAFASAVPMLRWMLLGDVLRCITVPLVYVLAAFEMRTLYLLIPTLWQLVFVASTLLLTPEWGIEGAGVAYLLAHAVYLVAAFLAVGRTIGALPGAAMAKTATVIFVLAVVTHATAIWDGAVGMVVGTALAALWLLPIGLRKLK